MSAPLKSTLLPSAAVVSVMSTPGPLRLNVHVYAGFTAPETVLRTLADAFLSLRKVHTISSPGSTAKLTPVS